MKTNIAVIGAGMAGLICAKELSRKGQEVTLIEKSGGVGGRMATRRLNGTHLDHGAQYIVVHGDEFGRFMQKMQAQGIVQHWLNQIYQLTPNGLQAPPPEDVYPRFCSPQGMTAIAKHLALEQQILLRTRVVTAKFSDRQWLLTTETGLEISAKAIVSAIPAPQFLAIFAPGLAELPNLLKAVRSVKFLPSVTVMAGYDQALKVPNEWRAIRCMDNSVLSWIGCNSSKHPEVDQAPTFVYQSTGEFANQFLEESDLESQGRIMLTEVGKLLASDLSEPLWWQVHRWRYAIPQETLGAACLTTKVPGPLICAGDWCAGKNVEAAYLSGMTAAASLLEML
jgi:renalase